MVDLKQINCFKINMKFWKILGVYPYKEMNIYYNLYSKLFFVVFIVFYDVLLTVNFFYMPNQLDAFIEEMLFYFTEIAVISKVLTFLHMRKRVIKVLDFLESPVFQPITENGIKILKKAKAFNIRYWKIVAAISLISNLTHILSGFIAHLFLPVTLELPICSYIFLPVEIRERFIYPLYFYQSIGMHFHMLSNLNIDTFFLGLMILIIAQLEILSEKLSNLTNKSNIENLDIECYENSVTVNLNQAIIHYDELDKFCKFVQDVFSVTLFVQFGVASCIICVCLFRFTLPATWEYYVFLSTYMFIMLIQIMVPCWFGTRIMEKSCLLSQAIYNCDWIPRTQKFKSSLRLFVERANRPLSITGGKMFPLSLVAFTSIINSAYSFFTLLRHMQTTENQK